MQRERCLLDPSLLEKTRFDVFADLLHLDVVRFCRPTLVHFQQGLCLRRTLAWRQVSKTIEEVFAMQRMLFVIKRQ